MINSEKQSSVVTSKQHSEHLDPLSQVWVEVLWPYMYYKKWPLTSIHTSQFKLAFQLKLFSLEGPFDLNHWSQKSNHLVTNLMKSHHHWPKYRTILPAQYKIVSSRSALNSKNCIVKISSFYFKVNAQYHAEWSLPVSSLARSLCLVQYLYNILASYSLGKLSSITVQSLLLLCATHRDKFFL